jgi:hypothetical protein
MDKGDRWGGDGMLAQHPIDVMLTATDLRVANQFYSDRTGHEVLIESNDLVTFRWRRQPTGHPPDHQRDQRAHD